MSGRLSLCQGVTLTVYAAAMASGELLFKTPVPADVGDDPPLAGIAGVVLGGYFPVALIFHAAQIVLCVWVLNATPFPHPYPFPALAFAGWLTMPLMIGRAPILFVAG